MNASFEPKEQERSRYSHRNECQSAISSPSRTIVHAKLEMTEPGDHDEQEADAVANTIVSGGKIARKISGGGGSSGIAVSTQMESQLSQLQGGGRQMPEGLRNMMENGFGQDFSQVRLHTDNEAANMSSSIHAKAFTLGNDIYFNQGQFSPNTTEGQRLVAHELTHVVQGSGRIGREPRGYVNDQTPASATNTNSHSDELERIVISDEGINYVDIILDLSPYDQSSFEQRVEDLRVANLIDYLINTASKEADAGYREKQVEIMSAEITKIGNKYPYFNKLYGESSKLLWSDLVAKGKELSNQKTDKSKEISKAISAIKTDCINDTGTVKNKRDTSDPEKQMSFMDFLKIPNGYEYVSKNFYAYDGGGNFTKFPDLISQGWGRGDEWCDWFVHWCFVNAFHPLGFDTSAENYNEMRSVIFEYTMFENLDLYKRDRKGKLIRDKGTHKKYKDNPVRGGVSSTKTLFETAKDAERYNRIDNPVPDDFITYFKREEGEPRKGDVILFKNDNNTPSHIGLVVNVKNNIVYTIEGNTGDGKVTRDEAFSDNQDATDSNAVNPAGNGVYYKRYNKKDKKIDGYGRPDYRGLLHHLTEYYNSQPLVL